MKYAKDKRTGNNMSILGFGCMRFPKVRGKIDFAATEKLIMQAIEGGVNYFDTAYIYTKSEETLGEILEKNNVRDKVFIATKLPVMRVKSGADFDRFFDRQLVRLKTTYIDYFLLHMLTDLPLFEKLLEWGIGDWIRKKREAGVIKAVGFSFHGSKDHFMGILNAYDWDFCQIQYNYSDENYQAGKAGLHAAYAKGIPVVIMEPLLGGKLVNGLPDKAQARLKAQDPNVSPAAWGLRWLYDQKEVSVVLSGMTYPAQLAENIATADAAQIGSLTDSERQMYEDVRRIFSDSYKIKCTGCAYCMPCPQNVNIPECFASYNTYFAHSKYEGIRQYLKCTGVIGQTRQGAHSCVKCGKCEKHCPQNIQIIDRLDEVKKTLEPPVVRVSVKIARKVLGRG